MRRRFMLMLFGVLRYCCPMLPSDLGVTILQFFETHLKKSNNNNVGRI